MTGTVRLPFFATTRGEPRERSGSDVLVALASLVAVATLAAVAVPPSGFEAALIDLVGTVPGFVDVLWRLGIGAAIVWTVALVLIAAFRRRGAALVDMVGSAAIAVFVALVLAARINGQLPSGSQIFTGGSAGTVPLVALAGAATLNSAASPHLSRPARRLGRLTIWFAAFSSVMLASTSPSGAALSVLVGSLCAALLHVAIGSSVGRPDLGDVERTLTDVGFPLHDVTASAAQSSGVYLVEAVSLVHGPVLIKVYGRDARDTQLLARTWRALWYRGRAPIAASRQHQVEHEAFVTLFAASRGLAVPEVLSAGQTGGRDAVLVLGAGGTPVTQLDTVDDELIASMWSTVTALHSIGFAHGELSPEVFAFDGDRPLLTDLGAARTADSGDQICTDLAQLLVVTATLVGIERAVVIAGAQLDADVVAEMLPYLQPPALGASLRRSLKGASWDLDALRAALAGVIGAEVPELIKLRRVSPQTLGAVLLVALVVFALVASLSGIDPEELWDELRNASPGWALAALLAAQLPFLSGAVATRGACPRPLSYGPVAMFELAVGFVALAVPSTAGRLALGIRFFQRQGVPPTAAVSISAIDSFSGFLVQMFVLLVTLGVGVGHVQLDFSLPADRSFDNLSVLLGVAAALLVLLVALAFGLPRIRRRIFERVRPLLGEVAGTLRSLRSPSKLLQLFGGNIGNQILFAVALGLSLRAFGGELNLATLLVIYVGAALFGGLMPVPGGIGVVEAALMAGLIAAGIDATTASATALLFRASTFYLPPIWGFVALRWLQRNSYL